MVLYKYFVFTYQTCTFNSNSIYYGQYDEQEWNIMENLIDCHPKVVKRK